MIIYIKICTHWLFFGDLDKKRPLRSLSIIVRLNIIYLYTYIYYEIRVQGCGSLPGRLNAVEEARGFTVIPYYTCPFCRFRPLKIVNRQLMRKNWSISAIRYGVLSSDDNNTIFGVFVIRDIEINSWKFSINIRLGRGLAGRPSREIERGVQRRHCFCSRTGKISVRTDRSCGSRSN